MTYELDSIFISEVGESYLFKSDHRNGSREKSQWTIEKGEELAVFQEAFKSNWISDVKVYAWGLYLSNGRPCALGISARKDIPKQNLWLAKFVRSLDPFFWHGYPANYRLKAQDRPGIGILKDWYQRGHIKKHEIAKIRGGQRCSLSD